MADVFIKLMESTNILFIVIGILLMLVGVSGGINIGTFVLQIAETISRVLISTVGLILLAIGVVRNLRNPKEIKVETKVLESGHDQPSKEIVKNQQDNFVVKDTIRIDYTYKGLYPDGVIKNFDPRKGLSSVDRDSVIYSHPLLYVDVVSQVNDEWIKLAPYLVVDIISTEPFAEASNYFATWGKGGGGSSKDFLTVLSPNQSKISGAPQLYALKPDSDEAFDYFTLEPGERESFILTINLIPGYLYNFKVGVFYSYKGTQDITWIDRVFLCGIPRKAKEWVLNFDGRLLEITDDEQSELFRLNNESDWKKDTLSKIMYTMDGIHKKSDFILPD